MNLLLIDDDPTDAFLAKNTLNKLNITIMLDYYKDVDSALAAFAGKYYDLVIVDLNLGRISGYEVIRLIKAIDKDIDIVVHTGSREMLDVKLAYDLGATEVLSKNINFSQLKDYVSKFYRCLNCLNSDTCRDVWGANNEDNQTWRSPINCHFRNSCKRQQAETV